MKKSNPASNTFGWQGALNKWFEQKKIAQDRQLLKALTLGFMYGAGPSKISHIILGDQEDCRSCKHAEFCHSGYNEEGIMVFGSTKCTCGCKEYVPSCNLRYCEYLQNKKEKANGEKETSRSI